MAGFSDLGFMQRARRLVVGAIMLGLGGVVGFALPHSSASPSTQTGSVISVGNATTDAGFQFWFKPVKGAKEEFRLQPATPWQNSSSGRWHNKGEPSCLVPRTTSATPATIGVVGISSVGSAKGRSIVVWVECYTWTGARTRPLPLSGKTGLSPRLSRPRRRAAVRPDWG